MIEVKIPAEDIKRLEGRNEVLAGVTVWQTLKNAGVPIGGTLFAWCVERGTLTMTFDDVFDEYVYTWSE